jgi:hypothetical protein
MGNKNAEGAISMSELCPDWRRWDDERRYGSREARKYFR